MAEADVTAMGPDPSQSAVIAEKWNKKITVSAGPGTGKSYTAALRVAEVLQQLSEIPEKAEASVVCLTFTNSATGVTAGRLRKLGIFSGVEVRTIDSWSSRLREVLGRDVDFDNQGYEANIDSLIATIRNTPDFEFLTEIAHIVVDEAQDLYGVRRKLLEILLERGLIEGWTVLGDVAQSIYEYGTEDAELSFLEDVINRGKFDGAFELDIDHRSTNANRALGKDLRSLTPSKQGIDAVWDEYMGLNVLTAGQLAAAAEGYNNSGQSVGILVRDNRQLLELSQKLSGVSIVHQTLIDASASTFPAWLAELDGVSFKDEALSAAPSYVDADALSRLFERWSQGGQAKRFSVERFSNSLKNRKTPQILLTRDPEIVSLSTIHRAKGLEYQKVIVGMNRNLDNSEIQGKQEARLLFVALTRSRGQVIRLDLEGLKLRSSVNKKHKRWVDLEFRGKSPVNTGLEVKMSDFSFLRQPTRLQIGDPVVVRSFRRVDQGTLVFGAYDVGSDDPFATLSLDFSNALDEIFKGREILELVGLSVSSYSGYVVPNNSDKWGQRFLAKVPYMAGMVRIKGKD
jgi:superfamily I DNA/RNA helicase